ncbi:MAG: hypothetical protein WA705_20400 [Candidatus Ozemobacteraceae bacterium]
MIGHEKKMLKKLLMFCVCLVIIILVASQAFPVKLRLSIPQSFPIPGGALGCAIAAVKQVSVIASISFPVAMAIQADENIEVTIPRNASVDVRVTSNVGLDGSLLSIDPETLEMRSSCPISVSLKGITVAEVQEVSKISQGIEVTVKLKLAQLLLHVILCKSDSLKSVSRQQLPDITVSSLRIILDKDKELLFNPNLSFRTASSGAVLELNNVKIKNGRFEEGLWSLRGEICGRCAFVGVMCKDLGRGQVNIRGSIKSEHLDDTGFILNEGTVEIASGSLSKTEAYCSAVVRTATLNCSGDAQFNSEWQLLGTQCQASLSTTLLGVDARSGSDSLQIGELSLPQMGVRFALKPSKIGDKSTSVEFENFSIEQQKAVMVRDASWFRSSDGERLQIEGINGELASGAVTYDKTIIFNLNQLIAASSKMSILRPQSGEITLWGLKGTVSGISESAEFGKIQPLFSSSASAELNGTVDKLIINNKEKNILSAEGVKCNMSISSDRNQTLVSGSVEAAVENGGVINGISMHDNNLKIGIGRAVVKPTGNGVCEVEFENLIVKMPKERIMNGLRAIIPQRTPEKIIDIPVKAFFMTLSLGTVEGVRLKWYAHDIKIDKFEFGTNAASAVLGGRIQTNLEAKVLTIHMKPTHGQAPYACFKKGKWDIPYPCVCWHDVSGPPIPETHHDWTNAISVDIGLGISGTVSVSMPHDTKLGEASVSGLFVAGGFDINSCPGWIEKNYYSEILGWANLDRRDIEPVKIFESLSPDMVAKLNRAIIRQASFSSSGSDIEIRCNGAFQLE